MITPVPEVAALSLYATPALPTSVELRLDGTERPVVLEDVGDAAAYPKAGVLEAALAERYGVTQPRVLVTAGADEALDRICRAYLSGVRAAVMTAPTFEMIRHYARLAGAQIRDVPWYSGGLNASRVLEATREMRGICAIVSPNNPTGLVADADLLVTIARERPDVLLVVDLAYVEFADVDPTKRLLEHANVVITRTFSKAWGIPGARVGYALGAPDVIAAMRLAGGPYSVARPSLALALQRLTTGEDEMRAYVATARAEVATLRALLTGRGYDVPASQANFVLPRGPNVPALAEALAIRGFGTRAFPNDPALADARRLTAPGDSKTFARLEAALTELA